MNTSVKRIISCVFLFAFCFLSFGGIAFADSVDKRVVLGINNSEAAIAKIYGYFRVDPGSVDQMYITNQEEREYLEGLVPNSKIGTVALSSVYIDTDNKSGLDLEIYNINWVTEEMYRNALATAGITDAKVIVAAATPVSGTGALAGIYKAYEDITGVEIDQEVKDTAVEELVITADLQEVAGDDASSIISDLKAELAKTKNMDDVSIQELIVETASKYNAELSDSQVEQILELIKKLNSLNIDFDTFEKIANAGKGIEGFFESVGNFFKSIGDWFTGLFGGNKEPNTDDVLTEEEAVVSNPPQSPPDLEIIDVAGIDPEGNIIGDESTPLSTPQAS